MKKVELEKKHSLAGKLFRRLLRSSVGFQESVGSQERDAQAGVSGNSYYDYQKEVKTALLDAERRKVRQ